MSVQIVASSPQAEALANDPNAVIAGQRRTIYPFNKLQKGQSFTVPKADAKIKSIRLIAKRKSVDGKQFAVIEHESPAVIEVARIS